MMPHERQARIKSLIANRHSMKISELSSMLGVSEMTIHRDVQKLVQEGTILKTFGGITLRDEPQTNEQHCVVCQRRNHPRLSYRLIMKHNRIDTACCAHCGLLRHHQLQSDILQAICYDFLSNTTISAPASWYVMDSEVDVQCCQPQVLSFEQKHVAMRFVTGFGGVVLNFPQASERVRSIMEKGCCDNG